MELAYNEERATDIAIYAPSNNENITIVSTPIVHTPFVTPTLATGIFPGGLGISEHDFLMNNTWAGIVNGNYYEVIAGSKMSDPDQGKIVILIFSNRNAVISSKTIDAPLNSGTFSISQAQGNRLKLTSDNGQTFYFDVQTLQYFSSLNSTIPTTLPLRISTTQTPSVYAYP